MTLSSTTAALLFAALAAVYWLVPPGRARIAWLALSSIAVFGLTQGYAVIPLIGMLALAVLAAALIRRGWRWAFVAGVAIIVAVLFAAKWPGAPWRTGAGAAWTIGLSYFAFHAISVLMAERRAARVNDPPASALEIAAHIAFAPTALAGPIKNFDRFAASRPVSRGPKSEDVAAGVSRAVIGLFKTVVLAGTLAPMTQPLQTPATSGALACLMAIYAYAFHIYFDFSGYTDIAVGLSRILGYRIEENFDWPYLKSNIRDFWRSWHMSLTAFLRDAVYIPLGGSRGAAWQTYANIVVVFFLIGAWHGLEGHFLAWGLYHAAGMIAYRLWAARRSRGTAPVPPTRLSRRAGVVVTFHFVAVGWILFACDLSKAWLVLKVIGRGILG